MNVNVVQEIKFSITAWASNQIYHLVQSSLPNKLSIQKKVDSDGNAITSFHDSELGRVWLQQDYRAKTNDVYSI